MTFIVITFFREKRNNKREVINLQAFPWISSIGYRLSSTVWVIAFAIVNWFQSYLSDRSKFIRINSTLSDPLPVSHGVPQGVILSPLIFCIYMNDFSFIWWLLHRSAGQSHVLSVAGFLLSCSSLLLALNFNSAFCCFSRGVLPGEDLHPLFESFLGHLRWRKLLVIKSHNGTGRES